jgi:uncharacterized protein (TIGR02271 family)
MATTEQALEWRGSDLIDRDGDKIGKIEEIYLDTDTDQPEWALVHTGLFGGKGTFVPLREASPDGDAIRVPYEKAHVKDAPGVEADGQLSEREEAELYRHYGVEYGAGGSGSGNGGSTGRGDDASTGRDVSGPETDSAMTRSEEELNVGTAQRESGRVRLRKYIVTEDVQTTVPVSREEVRIEREPITDANVGDAKDGPELSEEEHEVTLHTEEPVVEKRVVPKERVRLDKDTIQEERQVSESVAKEQIEVDGDVDEDAGRR